MKDITLRLTNVLYRKEFIRKYLSSFQQIFDDIETAVDVLKRMRWIDSAIGVQLDGCGSIVNEKRLGRDDDEYREAILFRIFINVSTGSIPDKNKAVGILTKPDEQHHWESYPASFIHFTDGPVVPEGIGEILKDISCAGLGYSSLHVSYASPAFFLTGSGKNKHLTVAGKRFKTDGKKLKIGDVSYKDNGSHLGGISMPKLVVSSKNLTIGGKRLKINANVKQTIISSGRNLTGAFEV